MVTLTLPGEWEHLVPTPTQFQSMVRRFTRRLAWALDHRSTLAMVWKLEFQARGAPHLHTLLALPRSIGDESIIAWVSRNWFEVVGSADERHLKAGTSIDWSGSQMLTDAMRMAVYFSRHANAGQSKAYQHEIPDLWRGQSFRFWGYSGLRADETPYALNRRQGYEVLRLLRKHYRATHPPVIKNRRRRVWYPEPIPERPEAGRWETHEGRLYERKVVRGASPTTGELRFRYVYRRPEAHSLRGDHRSRGGFVLTPGASDLAAALLRAVADYDDPPVSCVFPEAREAASLEMPRAYFDCLGGPGNE